MKQMTVKQFFAKYPTDAACLAQIFDVRFGQGHTCEKCEREAKWYPIKAERAFSCGHCGNHIHPTVGTIFEGSRTSLQSWFYAIYLFTTTRHGVPAKELERQLGVTYKTAWRMGHKIREHMATIDGDEPLSGHVEVDEAFIGGKMSGVSIKEAKAAKTVVLGMVERDGDVHTEIIPNVKGETLIPAVEKVVEKGSTISTDQHKPYQALGDKGYEHGSVNHGAGEYVDGIHHTNGIEGFWSQLKKGISGSHVHVSKKHLDKYTKEFEYRYNARKHPEEMFSELTSSYPELPDQE